MKLVIFDNIVDKYKNAVFDNLQQLWGEKHIYFHSSKTDKNEFTIDRRKNIKQTMTATKSQATVCHYLKQRKQLEKKQ